MRKMKKQLFFGGLGLFFCLLSGAQTATSVASGNWTNPLTWNCTCVPTPGYAVIINHNVTLNTSFAYTSGSITINSSGSLIEDVVTRDIWLNGGTLSNSRSLDVRYLFTQSGSFSNSGTITARAFLNYLSFTNTGTFQNLDSLYNTGAITNTGNFLNIDSITNAGTFINNGACAYNQFTNNGPYTNNNNLTFTDITNNNLLTNADTLIALHSCWNQGDFNILPGSYFLVTKSFLNDDMINHDAVFTNNGEVNVLDSWYNMDTVKGSAGSFIVQDTSYNAGAFKQSFDFCDLTPPGSAPYIDINLGSVSGGITWCTNSISEEDPAADILVYPNPTSNILFVRSDEHADLTLKIYNALGELVLEVKNVSFVNLGEFPGGLYTLLLAGDQKRTIKKIQVIK